MRFWAVLCLLFGLTVGANAQVYRARQSTNTPVEAPNDGNPAIGITGDCSNGVLATQTTPETIVGTSADDLLVVSVTCSNSLGGSCSVASTLSWTATIALSVGDNVITFTASDGSPPHATASCTITYTAPAGDTTDPTTTITSPADDSQSAQSSITVTGTCADDTLCDHTEVRVNGGAWVTATGSPTSWTRSGVALALGANVIEARAYDAAGNIDETPAAVDVERVQGEGLPTVTITSPVAGTTSTNDLDFLGTCEDDVTCLRCKVYPEATAALISVSSNAVNASLATPADTNRNFTLNNRKPKLGTHTYLVRCWDDLNDNTHYGEASVEVTFTRVAVMMTQGAPPAQTGTAYSYDFYADGDDGNFTWDIGSDGVTTFADADCAGLSISTVDLGDGYKVGRVSGTPSGSGTCTLTMRAKGTSSNASTSIGISIGAGALEGPNAHYTTIAALTEAQSANGGRAFSFRDPTAGTANELSPFVVGAVNLSNPDTAWAFTSSYAQHNFGLLHHSTTSSHSQVKFPLGGTPSSWTGFNDGKLLIMYDIWWDKNWRVMGCRGGVINQVQGAHWNQKETNIFSDDDPSVTDAEIDLETNTEAGGQSNNELCVRSSQHAERFNGAEIIPSDIVLQANPTGAANGAHQTCMASSFGQIVEKGIEIYPLTWYRRWYYVELNVDETNFADYNSCASDPLPAGNYDKVYAWMQSEWDATPQVRIWALPASNVKGNGNIVDRASQFVFELNTSANPGSIIGDVHLRLRNLLILRNYTLPATPTSDTTIFSGPPRR